MLKSELRNRLLNVISIVQDKMKNDLYSVTKYQIEEEFDNIRYDLGEDDYMMEMDIDTIESRVINILNDLKDLKDDDSND
jgi:hypothetical protein